MSKVVETKTTPTLEAVMDFAIDTSGEPYSFTKRLAKENRWPLTFAVRVTDEYKKFMFLAAVSGLPVSPSPAVDQAWHLHLLYTHSYWDGLCAKVLGQTIHHLPSSGRTEDPAKFASWYADTLESYRRLIGSEPPDDIWPATIGQHPDLRWIDLRRHWIIRKPWQRP